jgi:hypothetical protein
VLAETVVDCPASRRLREAETLETTGKRLKEMLTAALPVETPETTLTTNETEAAAPWESVTVKVRVWTPVEVGAVHEVVAAAGAEKEPPEAVQARVRVSLALGSWTVAVREREAPVCTEVEEATTESMTGASLP